MEGWVKLWRISLESIVFQNANLWKVWSYCLIRANHKEAKVNFNGTEIVLQPGEFITGRFAGSQDCHMSPSTYLLQLNKLKKLQNIDTKSDNKKTVITIINWAYYQGNGIKPNTKSDNKKTTKCHQNDTDKNNKNEKKYNENSIEFYLSNLLFELIKKRDEKIKEPDFNKWANHINKIIRLDNRTPDEIKSVIIWTQQNDFWQNNILSTDKLRKQFEQLFLQMNKGSSQSTNYNSNGNEDSFTQRLLKENIEE